MTSTRSVVRLLGLALVVAMAACSIEGPGPDDGEPATLPPDDVYDPDDGEATVAEYAPSVEFDKNRVIEDEELTDWDAMTVSEVQAFLNHNPYGWKSVLADHVSNGKSAAQAIVDAAAAHKVNPIVVLTRLQLEQSLIGKSSAPTSTLDKAMGCGCPDGGGCSTQYKGFDKQILCMASKFESYLADIASDNSTIAGWGVNKTKSTLDGYSVKPANAATAAIYTYTPWVSSAKNHRKIWVLYANFVNYVPPSQGGSGGDPGDNMGGSDPGSGGAGGDPPVGAQACFPGLNNDGTACVPTVSHSSAWGPAYSYPASNSADYQPPLSYIDLATADPSLKLAPNFRLDELMQVSKGQYGMFQAHVVQKLQAIRNQVGALSVNSGYRNVSYNAGVGGATFSRHMYGDAFDFKSNSVSLNTLKTKCTNQGADYISVYSGHVHCDWRYATKDPAFYGMAMMMFGGEYHDAALPYHSAEITMLDDRLHAPASGFDEGEPMREWTAYDDDGIEIETAVGDSYEPPRGTHSVTVDVAGQVLLHQVL